MSLRCSGPSRSAQRPRRSTRAAGASARSVTAAHTRPTWGKTAGSRCGPSCREPGARIRLGGPHEPASTREQQGRCVTAPAARCRESQLVSWRRSSSEAWTEMRRGLACSAMGIRSMQDAAVVRGVDVLGVQGVPEEQLPGVDAQRPLGDLHLDGAVHGQGAALGPHGQDVALDVELDGVGVDAGEVEDGHEVVAVAVRVHGHGGGSGPASAAGAGEVLGEAVELAEGVGAHQHGPPPQVVNGEVNARDML